MYAHKIVCHFARFLPYNNVVYAVASCRYEFASFFTNSIPVNSINRRPRSRDPYKSIPFTILGPSRASGGNKLRLSVVQVSLALSACVPPRFFLFFSSSSSLSLLYFSSLLSRVTRERAWAAGARLCLRSSVTKTSDRELRDRGRERYCENSI